MDHGSTPPDAGERYLVRVATVLAAVFALLQLYGAFFPSSSNWGFHFLGFFPLPFRIIVPLLMLSCLHPAVRDRLLRLLTAITPDRKPHRRWMRPVVAAPVLTVVVAILWIARQKLSLMGDGFMVVRRVALIGDTLDVANVFKHEPLPGYFMWRFWQLFGALGLTVPDDFPTRLVSLLSGTGSIVLIWLIARRVLNEWSERILFFIFVLSAGTTQLFFAYMENYTLLYFAILLFTYLSVRHLKDGLPLAWPMGGMGLLFATHFASLIFLPAAAFLGWRVLRSKRWAELPAGFVSFILVAGILLWMCGYTVGSFFTLLFHSGKHIIPLTEITSRYQAYTFLSWEHILNLANLHLIVSPFAPGLFVTACLTRWRTILREDPLLTFMAIGAGCGILFTTTLNIDLGMSRDWDLPASFHVMLLLAAGLFCLRFIEAPGRRRGLMAMMCGIMLLHSGFWIALNADTERSLERVEMLPDERYWGTSAMSTWYEVLGFLYFEWGDLNMTAKNFEQYVKYDSPYVKVWEMLGDVYRHLGDEDNELRAYEGAINDGSKNPTAFINAGLVHASRGNIERAIELTQKALELNPLSIEAWNNEGIYIMESTGDCDDALPLFLRAIEIDSTFSGAYINAARCFLMTGDSVNALSHAREYMRLAPGGSYATEATEIINGITEEKGK